eukprot:1340146-Amorphochlora_amoeboformis.AAC.1
MLQLIDKDCKVESAARKPHVVERKTHATFRQRNTHLFIDHDSNITKLDQVLEAPTHTKRYTIHQYRRERTF